MSLIKLAPDASGTGIFTIASPNSNTNRTLTLPDNTGTILTSATTTGFPAGSVIQVVQGTYATGTSNSTSTFTDTGLSASITPTSSSSKILVLVNHSTNQKSAGSIDNSLSLRLVRGSTTIVTFAEYLGYTNSALLMIFSASFSYLDSPSTTSSTTYKTQFASSFNTSQVTICSNNTPATITLLEIAA
jgi:hypothetical protein